MINPEELRIGNLLIDDKTKKKVIVDAVTSETICVRNPKDKSVYYVFRHYLSPIPLSPEILEKAGFEKDESSHFSLTVSVYSNGKFTLKKSWSDYDPEWYAFTHLTDIRLYNLHQLQNLYYCLTGTELIINL